MRLRAAHEMDGTAPFLLWLALCAGAEPSHRDQSVNGTMVPHDYMLFLYRTLSALQPIDNGTSAGAGFANTVRSFVDRGKDLPSWESGQRYIFDLSSMSPMDKLVEVELRILRKPAVDLLTVLRSGGNLYNIRVYSCSHEGTSGRHLLDSRTVEVLDSDLPRWEVFDVWSSKKSHLRNPTESLWACFHVLASSELTNQVTDPLLLGLQHHVRPPQHKALLVTFSHVDTSDNLFREKMEKVKMGGGGFGLPKSLKPFQKHEKKHGGLRQRALSKRSFGGIGQRAATDEPGGKTGHRRSRCSRKPLHVNFKDLGWDDWIIAPLDYEANHCEGVCDFPLRSHLEPTNHAVIQTLMNSMVPDISPPSCCVPSKLSSISILYIDSGNNVVYKRYEDMVVESCGCR